MYRPYSVVIPAYNASANIAAAVQSVLSQTVPPLAVIVIDDGSTDKTAKVVRSLRGPIQLICRDNGGPGAATTQGFQSVATPLIATLDSDDLWLPTKLERQFDYLAAQPHTTAVFTLSQTFQGDSARHAEGLVARGWSRTTMLIETKAALSVGPIVDPPGNRGEMIDWLARCTEAGHTLGMVEEVLALRRVRPGSLSYGRDAVLDAGYLHVARQALARKKQRTAAAQGA
jgi:glycosyltransferase involved in cell wall biosynthesis